MSNRPLWAEISRRHLLANYERLCQAGSSKEILAVVKADAYGHGVLLCAELLAGAGVRWMGVTGAEEGIALRAICPEARVLLMSGLWPGDADAVIEHRLTPVVWEPYHLDLLEEAAARRQMPAGSIPVHLELDTGMSRQGLRVTRSGFGIQSELVTLLARFHARSCLSLEGIMTHFSMPEAISGANPQVSSLASALELILDYGVRPQWLHAGNSSTLVFGPDLEELERIAARAGIALLLRPGLALYGYLDRFQYDGEPVSAEGVRPHTPSGEGFTPILSWKTRVTSLRSIACGETVGYDDTFIARRETRLALLPVGYADGYNRLLSNRGYVLVRGEQAPIAGRISMDQMVVDVTDIPGVSVGEEAVLIGRQGRRSVTAWDLADLTGTVPWEVLCAIGARVQRIAMP